MGDASSDKDSYLAEDVKDHRMKATAKKTTDVGTAEKMPNVDTAEEPSDDGLTERLWDRLSEAAADVLGDLEGSPENVQSVATALLAMAARASYMTGKSDETSFVRAARYAYVGGVKILELEEVSPELVQKRRADWLTCLCWRLKGGKA